MNRSGISLLPLAAVAISLFQTPAAAQCPADDGALNHDCASAAAGATGLTDGLAVQDVASDYWSYTIPPGETLSVDAQFQDSTGNIDLELFGSTNNCSNLIAVASTSQDDESLSLTNIGDVPFSVVLRVFLSSGTCNNYSLDVVIATVPFPCEMATEDTEEIASGDNDTCLTAKIPSANSLDDLFVSIDDPDFYSYTLQAGEFLDVHLDYLNAIGDVDAQLLADDCATLLGLADFSFSDFEDLEFTNSTSAPMTVILRVFIDSGSVGQCNNYDLSATVSPDPCRLAADDPFEENDDCTQATQIAPSTYNGIFVRKEGVDEDWFSVLVLPSATINVSLSFINEDGDVDIDLFDSCEGSLVDTGTSTADFEEVSWTNMGSTAALAKIGIFVWAGDPTEDCNVFDMTITVSGGGPILLTPYCFGDGSGTPCPCGNNSSSGHSGGCANSTGNGATLVGSGSPSVTDDTLNFDLFSAGLGTFALLVSADNQRPQTGGCLGCGVPAFDGLVCAGGQMLRHGTRMTNGKGDTGGGWGPAGDPSGGLIAANGFTAGQTRNFFAFYRDDVNASCGFGQNSSNGISVAFQP